MISYTKKNVLIITLLLTILIYVVISVILTNINKVKSTNDIETEEIIVQETQENVEPNENIWQIQIPKLNLVANIAEGTNQKVIANNVGHFNQTSILNGNIGLAAHNRGYGDKSYFKNIKNLELGDEIIYQKNEEIRKYEVIENIIIDETDWTYLQNTNDNRITLITCVENDPPHRRCVQGIEKGS